MNPQEPQQLVMDQISSIGLEDAPFVALLPHLDTMTIKTLRTVCKAFRLEIDSVLTDMTPKFLRVSLYHLDYPETSYCCLLPVQGMHPVSCIYLLVSS